MTRPGVLVLTDDAEAYLPHLRELARQGTDLVAATTPQSARAAYAGQAVVLGQPDLVAATLPHQGQPAFVPSLSAEVPGIVEFPAVNLGVTVESMAGDARGVLEIEGFGIRRAVVELFPGHGRGVRRQQHRC